MTDDALDAPYVDLYTNPYPHYARAREAEGLTYLPEVDAWLVSRHADVREVLRRPEDFSSANALLADVHPSAAVLAELARGIGGGSTVVTADGEAHKRYRRPLNRGLSSGRVAEIIPFIRARAEALVGAFAADGRVELMASYARRLPGEVIGRLIGFDPSDVAFAVHGSYQAEALLFRALTDEEKVAAARDVVDLQHMLDRYARARRASPGEDLCTEMVLGLAPGTGELTLEQRGEIVSNLQNLLIAGHLTSTALIGTTLLHLLNHRDQWEAVCASPELIPSAVEEAARYDAAVQAFRRITTRTVALAGTTLPAGTHVLVAFGSANRDGARYERPDAFDITRPPARHLAFGHGVHGCPGSHLAREQVKITLETLAARLPGLRLDPVAPVAMVPTLIHRAPGALRLVW
ncbi:cytochrome P450 [Sinosporangium siamense]|uniref:Cytochrome P450 n=1 Tax=Sinosporangium siamense TaxID=1367973 RepID=A0A919RMN0_9ACTN|nr:cytochrome P450 [Sinosporangium siamense]GII95997.1 cytochrome P450 [Sinosporangium siamense]